MNQQEFETLMAELTDVTPAMLRLLAVGPGSSVAECAQASCKLLLLATVISVSTLKLPQGATKGIFEAMTAAGKQASLRYATGEG